MGPIDNNLVLIKIDHKPLFEPMMTRFFDAYMWF